jgi:hypothetical protein
MAGPLVIIFHRPANPGDPTLVRLLADVRRTLADQQSRLFRRAGVRDVRLIDDWREGMTFGQVLAELAPARGGLIVLSSGAVPRLNARDAEELVATAASNEPVALTNNRYSSDVCAVARALILRELPPLPTDNALPRWLEEHAGYAVSELRSLDRLALDLDTPLDVALASLAPDAKPWLSRVVRDAAIDVPRLDDVRAIATDPFRELLVFGRSGSRTLGWLERNVRCRVRFLAEERGLRAASPLAIEAAVGIPPRQRQPRATLGLLLDQAGPGALSEIVADLADGAIIDTRVLLAHRLGAGESGWPVPDDRFASDLHRPAQIADPWLLALTESAAGSRLPILLGGHTLVGPGIRLMLRAARI